MENKYIHYGHKEFRRDCFQPIKNDPEGWKPKPVGGLWASSVDAACGWKPWCEDNNFRKCSEDNSFTFTLTEDANVLRLKSARDLNALPKRKFWLEEALEVNCPWVLLDFEALQKRGVDAIEVEMNMGLYFALYGWDCDSILVMNPEVIVTVGREDSSSASGAAPSPEGEGKDGGTDSHVQCEHWTQNDTGDEGRKEPESGKRLEDMTRLELNEMLLELLEKFPEMDVDRVKAAIREVNRREDAEAVYLDDAIEAYKRRKANRELSQIPEAEQEELLEFGVTILARFALRQTADLGVKALLHAGAIDEYEAAELIGVERLVKRTGYTILRDKWE